LSSKTGTFSAGLFFVPVFFTVDYYFDELTLKNKPFFAVKIPQSIQIPSTSPKSKIYGENHGKFGA